jgi:hypothetical protein
MTAPTRLNSVPKTMMCVHEKIVGLIDGVCDKHLNTEYRDLARAMTAALCRKHGLLVDLRDMPREVQEIAFEDGLIPYIPADRKDRPW